MPVEVVIEDTRWASVTITSLAERACDATLRHLGLKPEEWEIVILACDDSRIHELNSEFRDKSQATNVLSWPSHERTADVEGATPDAPSGDTELGDIALAFETCKREAAEQKKSMEQHVLHLIVHGVLHLLGYDHVRNGDGDLMEATETAILLTLGVPDPY